MDSTNFHHHQQQEHLQDHFVGCSPTLNITSSSYGVSSSSSLEWNSTMLPTSTTSSNTTFSNNKSYENELLSTTTTISQSIPKIEDDMLSSFPSFSGLIHNPTNLENMNPWFNGFISSASNHSMPYNNRGLMHHFPLEVNNWSNNSSSNNNSSNGFCSTSIFNHLGLVSSPNNSNASTISNSSPRLGLNLEAMDLFGNNARFGAQSRAMSYGVGEEVISPAARKSMSNKASTLINGSLTGTKRTAASSNNSDQSKGSTTSTNSTVKKSSLKVSCPPFKVRKEKLGERIAALHQLVSPFGKTDTASVLTEAIGYIQFLQDQIHTLCMPHAKPSRSKPCRPPFQMGLGVEDEGKEDARIDLRRRGLCLVPFSWTSYITPTQLDASNHPQFF